MPYNKIFSFKIKIMKTINKRIMIGVVDEPKQRNQRSSSCSTNAVCYSGYTGKKFPSGGIEGNGFSEG